MFMELAKGDRGFEILVQVYDLAWSLEPLLPVIVGEGEARDWCSSRPGAAWALRERSGWGGVLNTMFNQICQPFLGYLRPGLGQGAEISEAGPQ